MLQLYTTSIWKGDRRHAFLNREEVSLDVEMHLLARACSQLGQPDESASEMNERQEGLGEFVVARGDVSELIDAVEEALDQIAVLVDMPIERTRIESVGARRNDSLAALCRDGFDEGIRVVALVGHTRRADL